MAESSNANTTVSGLKVSDILLSHPSLPNSLCLGPRSTESPAHLISCEANRIPFANQNLDLTSWADCLRAWPNPPEDWVSWYNRIAKTHQATWETTGIADALALSLSPLEKHENLLKTIGYFWSDALNCFMFGHGPMTPTLLDVAMTTGLDIASPSPSAFMLPKVPFNLSFISSTDGFETWWSMWKSHAFRRALGPLLKQLDAEYDIPAEQQQDGPEPVHDDGSPFRFLPPAPVVLFCKNSPPLKKVVMQSQPISPKSASKSRVSSGPAAPRASATARTAVRKVAARKTLKRQNPTPAQENLQASTEENSSEETQSSRRDSSSGDSEKTTTQNQPDLPPSASKKRSTPEPAASQAPNQAGQGGLHTKSRCIKRARKEPQTSSLNQEISNTDDTSSGEVEEVLMPSTTLDLATSKSVADKAATLAKPSAETQEPITSSSAAPMVLGEGYDLSSLLTFDPESIEPAASKASEESGPSATHGQLQHLKALLSSSIETLVEDPEEVKSILEDIQPHLPVTLQVKLWPVVTLSAYRSRVKLARQRIGLRHAQLPLKADIADKCQRLNEKKAALDAKTDTSVSTAELETLRKELEDLEERVRATKQLIQDKEALIAHSHEEAEGLKAELKTDLAEIRALNKQLVTGQDEDDEAEIAEVDRVRVDALHALEAFLQ
ncbi:hypothetical protein QYE76_051947 [Lolium multiflorum]|uniref:Aminotransferase-like plant mobile domain-containing protein n=1 Tax=Lolium multiflorum TaxID=4521 RepID=A0AAD8WKL7_LOLMU|nr:hypothetical protein QYE76_051947 [Lolium multiflorum]